MYIHIAELTYIYIYIHVYLYTYIYEYVYEDIHIERHIYIHNVDAPSLSRCFLTKKIRTDVRHIQTAGPRGRARSQCTNTPAPTVPPKKIKLMLPLCNGVSWEEFSELTWATPGRLRLDLGTTSQKCEAVSRKARIRGSWTLVSLNSRLESNQEKEKSRYASADWSHTKKNIKRLAFVGVVGVLCHHDVDAGTEHSHN